MSAEPIQASSDAELLAAWRVGDTRAGEQLVRNNYAVVERFLINKVGLERVSDLTQDTFAACVEARDRIVDGASFRPYLLKIAYRVFCAHLRREYRTGEALDLDQLSLANTDTSPSSLFARRREQRLLLEGLRAIPINYQTVLELHYWEQLTTTEIGEVLGIPSSTARTRLRRARDALAAALAASTRAPELLHSTLTRLEDWAELCRRDIGLDRPPT